VQPNQLPPIQSSLSPGSYYPQSATQQLNAVFGHEAIEPEKKAPHSAHGNDTVPQFSRIYGPADLEARVNAQPPFRRANPEGGFISPLQALTTHLPATYRICNPAFQYESSRNPRRVLTKPSKGVKNDGYDNEDSDYILYVNDILGSEETNHKNRYLILDVLGQGTFGQVVKCQNLKTQEVVAVKVVKNKTAYFNQSMMEVSVLDLLNGRMDKNDDHHILRLKDTFIHRQHLCLVFELLSVNLYELIKQNQFRGLSTTLVRVFAQQLLNGLCLLSKAKLIHCDLKPENILLKK
jgi:dual specificity protein kinase YAK1